MKINESEIMEFKTSTAELKEAVIAISVILNKHQKGELYFGINNKGDVVFKYKSIQVELLQRKGFLKQLDQEGEF